MSWLINKITRNKKSRALVHLLLLFCVLFSFLFPLPAISRVLFSGSKTISEKSRAVMQKPVKAAIKVGRPQDPAQKKYKVEFGKDEAEVGDFSSTEFKPQVKLKRWGDEAYLNVEISETNIPAQDKSVNLEDDRVGWESPKIGAGFYKQEQREVKVKDKKNKERGFILSENGGFEFEVVLYEKPLSNVITLPIQSKGLKFYYQGPLTYQEKAEGIVRPDEVVGSYAVYHESKKDGKYNTGKAFQIYRPKIIDADGNWVWADLNIDTESSVLKITIDANWLRNAAYPVVVDPEFGYTSIGSSAIPLENVMRGSIFTALEFTPASITAYLENTDLNAAHTAKYAIYKVSDTNLVGQTQEVTVPAATKGWYEGSYTTSFNLSAEEYALAANGNSGNILIYFDSGASQQSFFEAQDYASAWPETTAGFSGDDKIYSIYDATTATISITVTLDTTAPTAPSAATIVSGTGWNTNYISNTNKAAVKVSGTKSTDTTQIKIDIDDEEEPFTSPKTITLSSLGSGTTYADTTGIDVTTATALADGNIAIKITAYDAVGNTSTQSITKAGATIKKDIAAPTYTSTGTSYVHSTKLLTLKFNESIKITSVDATKFHLADAASSGNTLALSAPEITGSQSDGTTLTFTLTDANRDTVSTWGATAASLYVYLDVNALTDVAGNNIAAVSRTALATWTKDTVAPTASAPTSTAQTLKGGAVSTSTVQSTEAGNIYLVKNGTSASTQAQIDTAVTAHNAFAGKTGAAAATPYTITVAASLNDGVYDIVAVDNASNVSSAVAGWLTVDNTAPTNQDTVFAASVSKQGGASVTIVSSGTASNNVWFAPSGTTTFSAGATMTTAGGTATSIAAPATAGSYKMFVIDAAGNYSTASTATLTVDNTAPTNQDTVFAASVSKQGGASVTIVSSGDATNNVWFAPSGTTTFSAGATMTTAGGTATSIAAPATAGSYKMFVIDAAGNYSTASTATLTVDNTAPTNQDTVFAASVSKQGGASVTIVSSGDATNNVWFAPSGTTTFSAGATMTTAGGTATSIAAPATAGSYKMFVIDAAGNYSTASTATLTVDNTAPNAPTGLAFIPTGGTVTANYINSTNTGFTLTFSSPATEYAGTAHLYLNDSLLANDVTTTVSAASTICALTGNAQAITDLGADGAKVLNVKITDAAGNVGSASASFVVTHTAGSVAPVTKTVTYGMVVSSLSGASECWITQNLGATNQATSATDNTEASAGWYWQFNKPQGYKHDGTTRTPSTTWITSINENSDWTTTNDPCVLLLGTGWRLPTETEWNNADTNGQTGGWDDYTETYADVLKLHTAGWLNDTNGSLAGGSRGGWVAFWSSAQETGDNTISYTMYIASDASVIMSLPKSTGVPVRCLRDGGLGFNVTLDTIAPTAPSAVAFTPVGGTVVSNTLNTTNTNFTATATISAGTATGGTAELLKGGASFSTPITDTSIASGDTSVSFNAGFTTNGQVQSAFASGATLSVKITDLAGNSSTSSVSNPAITVDYTAPVNQDTVFAADVSKQGGANVTIVSSGTASNNIWFAPSGTTTFSAGATMTTAGGTATSILAPATAGSYKLFVIDAAGNYSAASTATLTVDNTAPTNQDTVFAADVSKQGGASVTIVSSGDASNNVWFAPSGTTVFSEGLTMTKAASGTATVIAAPATAGSYKLFVIDAVGNYSTASTATLTVDNTAPTASAPTSTAQTLKGGDVSTSTVQSTEAGNIYLVKTGTSASTQAEIDTAVTANNAFLGKSGAAANTPYTITVAASLNDGVYDIVAVDNAGNVSSAVAGWLTVDNTAPTNQDTVFAADVSKQGGASVTIVSSGTASNNVWFAPSGTTVFSEGLTMTKAASGTATVIAAPATAGSYKLFVIDAVGNYSTASTATLTVDNTAPTASAPTSTAQTLKGGDVSTSTVQSTEAGNIYLVKTGTSASTQAEIDTAVTANNAFLGKSGAAANTPYTITVAASLNDGVYDIVAVDNAGNVSSAVAGWLTVDNTAPTNQDTVFAADVSKQGGASVTIVSSGTASNNVWFAPSGTTVFSEGLTMTKAASGTATVIAAPATAGSYKLFVIDAVGNYSTASTATLTVDNTAPTASAPTSTAQTLKGGDVSTSTVQSTEAGNIYLVKTGTSASTQAEIDTAVTANNAFLGKSGAAANTPYTITVAASLNDGVYDIVAVDNAGNVSSAVAGWLTVDNTAPTNQDTVFAADVSKQGGASVTIVSSGTASNNVWFAPSGTTVFSEGLTMTKAASGTATVIAAPATAGSYKLFVIDAVGNYSTASTATLTVDNTAPTASAPTSTAQTLKGGDVSTSTVQSTEAGNIYLVKTGTSASTQAEIDTAVTANNAFLGKSGAAANTPYTITVAASLNDGVYDIVAVDNAGNVSSAVAGWLTVDNTAPTNQDTVFAADVSKQGGASVTIVSSGDASNNVWFAPSGTTVFSEGLTMTKAASGTATVIAAPATAGSYKLFVIDAVGNYSTASTATLTVDNTAPTASAPTSTAQTLKGGDVSTSTVQSTEAGNIYLVKTGTSASTQAEIDTAVTANNAFLGKSGAAANTPYTITVAASLNDGVYDIVAVDNAGNVSSAVAGWLTVDNTAPTNQDTVFAADVSKQGGASVTIVSSGTASNNVWFAPSGTTVFSEGLTMTKAASGTATVIAAPATAGSYKLFVIDAVGNYSTASTATLTVDNTAPTASAPTSTAQTLKGGDVSTSTVQSTEAGNIYLVKTGTSASTQAEIDTAVTANNAFLGKSGAAANTPYTITVAASLNDGVYDIVAVDNAGNVSSAVAGWLTVDNTAPTAPSAATIVSGTGWNTNYISNTNKAAVKVSGTKSTDTTQIKIDIDDEEEPFTSPKTITLSSLGSGTTYADTTGIDVTTATALADGNIAIKITAYDAVGNTSTQSITKAGATIKKDTTAPVAASVTTPADAAHFTDTNKPSSFAGSCADNTGGLGLNANSTTFYIRNSTNHYWDGTNWDATTEQWLATTHSATSSGTSAAWSSNVTLPNWTSGTYYAKAAAVDKAGNSFEGSEVTFTYDTTLSVSVSPAAWAKGSATEGNTYSTFNSNAAGYITVTNDGPDTEYLDIKASSSGGCSIAAAPDANIASIGFGQATGSSAPYTEAVSYTALSGTDANLVDSLASSGTYKFDLQLKSPTSTTYAGVEQTITVTVTAKAT